MRICGFSEFEPPGPIITAFVENYKGNSKFKVAVGIPREIGEKGVCIMCTKADKQWLIELVFEFCDVLGIEIPNYCKFKDLGPLDGKEVHLGFYNPKTRSIIVNVNYYNAATRPQIARFLVHELFHAWQADYAPRFHAACHAGRNQAFYEETYFDDGNVIEAPARLAELGYDPREAYAKFVRNPDFARGITIFQDKAVLKEMQHLLEEVHFVKQTTWPEHIMRELYPQKF